MPPAARRLRFVQELVELSKSWIEQEDEGQNLKSGESRLLDTAFIVFGATIAAYIFTYLYEMGFCAVLGVPWEFISLEGRDIFADVVGVLSATLVVEGSCLETLMLLVGMYATYKVFRDPKLRKIWRLVIPLLLLALAFFSNHPTGRVAVSLFFFGGIAVAVLWLIKEVYNLRWIKPFEFVAYLSAFLIISYYAGYRTAEIQKDYLVLSSSSDTVVLRVYGDKLITAQFDGKSHEVENKFKAINSEGQQVHWEPIGPLRLQSGNTPFPPIGPARK